MEKQKKNRLIWFFLCVLIMIFRSTGVGQHYNLKNYSIEEGLAQSQVRALYQASSGYLWIGTLGGGVSRFDGLSFANFTKKDGLSSNHVVSIFEDSQGNIWFGTYEGVSRYDGITFQPVQTGNGLSNSKVRAIAEDRQGNIWFGTEAGLWKYDGKEYSGFTVATGLADDVIMSMLVDSKGKIWIGTENGGIGRFDGRSFTNVSITTGLGDSTVYAILEDRKGNIWFTAPGGVGKYDGKDFTNYTMADGLNNNIIRAIIEDHDGNLWFGTNGGGIFKYDGKGFTYITEKNGLSSNMVWALLEDREGNIWIGTYRGGLDKYEGDVFTYFSSKDGLGDDVIRAIFEDRAGNFWFATFRAGVSKFDGKTVTTFTTKDGLVNDFVLTIYQDRKGNLWFGTYGGVSRYDGQKFINITAEDGLNDRVVRAIYEDRAGNLWFGTNTSGINRYNGKSITYITRKDGLPADDVTSIMEDRRENIWIGTTKGICFSDGKTFTDISGKCGFKQKNIYSIAQGAKDNLWLAAYGDGIIKFNATNLLKTLPEGTTGDKCDCSFEVFDSRDGLHDNNVVSIVFDDNGKLWIGTEKGISQFDVGEYEKSGRKIFKHYGREENLIGIECIHNSICKDRDGNIWFGTINGAIKYNPGREKSNLVPPLTHITGLHLLYGEESWLDYADALSLKDGLPLGLKLPYNKNYLEFDFMGLSFTAPGKVRYQYQLEGFDDFWVPGRVESYAGYPNLPPGKYTFKVKACNSDGIWNKEPASFYFEITPPFWSAWWFYLLCGFLVILALSVFIKVRIRGLEKQRKILRDKVKIATEELEKEKENVERINLELEDRVRERTSELKVSEEKFRLVVENANDAIFIVQDGLVKFPNPKTAEMLGYSEVELEKISLNGIIHPDGQDKEAGKQRGNPEEGRSPVTDSFRVKNKSGKEFRVEINSTPIQWEGKGAALYFLRDITEKKRLEAQLLDAQKMEAVGTMAGGIAHDFNNLLMGILGNASLILSEIDTGHPFYEGLKNVENYVQSGADLTRQLLGFARGGKFEVMPTELNRVVKNSSEMFNRTHKEITIHGKYKAGLWIAAVDRGQIEQVLVNLYVNAWQAMPGGGDIFLQTDNVVFGDDDMIPGGLNPGYYVRMSITDTGVGMDEATKQRIFEPFFTTKEMGRGTGLGLASVYGIIRNHGGAIQVNSEEGRGTTFTIYFPVAEREVVQEQKILKGYLTGSETILFVDDEKMVREISGKILKRLGYALFIAGSGKEAVAIYSKNRDKIDMVILDVIMPQMGGAETYNELRRIDPNVKVLIASGYSIDEQTEGMLAQGCRGFIQKPFGFEVLSRKIRSILDQKE
jgi:PAS domain S-box-containing protein